MATAAHNSQESLVGSCPSASANLRVHPCPPVHDDHAPNPPVEAAPRVDLPAAEQGKEQNGEHREEPNREQNKDHHEELNKEQNEGHYEERSKEHSHTGDTHIAVPGSHHSIANEELDHFAHAHGGRDHYHGAHEKLSIKHLFKRPIIRQWLSGGILYKGQREREATYVELFFDLMFVGIIHQLAERAVDPVSGDSFIRFIVVFYPSWSVWSDVRNFINASGVDDLAQRFYILANMLLLLGYSAMASSIDLEPVVPEAATAETTTAAGGEHVSYHLAENFHSPLRAAVAFLLVAKLLRFLLYMIYAVALPKFRISLCLSALLLLLPCAFWLPLVWIKTETAVAVLAYVAVVVELWGRYAVALVAKLDRKRALFGGHTWFAPALSIEHMMDRTSAFIVLVLGESIINATFTVDPAGRFVGLSTEYGRAAMSVVIAFEFMWLYFDADSSRAFVHALRRHWFTSLMFTHLHWPLSSSLVIVSAALREMVGTYKVERGLQWYFAGGISVALFTTGKWPPTRSRLGAASFSRRVSADSIAVAALIGWLHLSLDEPGTSFLPRRARLLFRVAVAVMFAVLPLADQPPNLEYLGIHAGALGFLILIETFGKLGARPADYVLDGEIPAGRGGKWSRWGHGVAMEDLTDAEMGEADVGVEGALGKIQTRPVQVHQRLAYII